MRRRPLYRPRLTLGQFIGLCFLGLAALLVALLSIFYAGSRRTILLASEELMRQASRRVTERIEGHLGEAERLLESFAWQADLGLVDPARLDTVESSLIGELTSHPQVTEVTLTYGRAVGRYEHDDGPHDAGDLKLAPDQSGQVSVARVGAGSDAGVVVRRLWQVGSRWQAEERRLPYETSPHTAAPPAVDPTIHATFTVPSREEHRGRALWSDLSYSEADAGLPEETRRRVVSVQKALWSNDETFLGVLRVSLLNNRIDEFTRLRVDERSASADPHVVFLCDRRGRLISRLGSADRFALLDADGKPDPDGDVRVVPASPPPQVAAALRAPVLNDVASGGSALVRLSVGGTPYLVSVASLLEDRTQGWLVGIVVPEAYYLSDLEASRRRALGDRGGPDARRRRGWRADAARDAPRPRAPDRRDDAPQRLRLRARRRTAADTFRDVQAAVAEPRASEDALCARSASTCRSTSCAQLYEARRRAHARRSDPGRDAALLRHRGLHHGLGAARRRTPSPSRSAPISRP